jgi:excisionase family DNA binding protein
MIEDLLAEMRAELRLQTELLRELKVLSHPPANDLVTVRDAALALSLSERTIRKRIASGEYPSYGSGRELRVDVTELRELMSRKVRA